MFTLSRLAAGFMLAVLVAVPVYAGDAPNPLFADASAPATDTTPAEALTNIIIHPYKGSLTVPSVEEQKDSIDQTVGSVGFVDNNQVQDSYDNTLRDVLKDSPGVFVENRYGQELRLSIRGSGIARAYHTRGIEILQDGIPTNLADGSGDYYEIDPLALRSTEIYKGGNGLAYGASTLGGAINFVTPTAETAEFPNILRIEGGSFGTARGQLQASRVVDDADFMANGTVLNADSYRDHEKSETEDFNANLGYRLSPTVETRFYAGTFITAQQLPGTLSLNDAIHNPTVANPAALTGDQARDERTERIANRTSIKLDYGQLDLDTWAIHKSLFHPIFQVIDQDGWTYGLAPRYTGTFMLGGNKNELITGARFYGGNNQALQYVNVNGSRGTQTFNGEQDAYNYEAYAEDRYWFVPQVAFMAGAKLFLGQRQYTDKGGLAADPAAKYDSKNYSGINPKAGFIWEPQKGIQSFVDVTRSQDVPDFTDLTQTTATTTQFVPLKTQDAWTVEVGSRGSYGSYGWDATFYHSWIRHELLQYTVDPNIPASTFNANNTMHQGIELGASMKVAENIIGKTEGDSVTVNQLWNWSDFRFTDDPQYGNNRIAGVPEHVLRTEITYRHKNGFYFTPAVDWVPVGAYADQANTLQAPGYMLLGLETGVQMNNGILFYIDARNLADERYVSDVSTITDARTANTAIFYPGEGRSIFAGICYGF